MTARRRSLGATLLCHQWRQACRSPYWHRSLAVKIVLGFFIAFLLLNLFGLGLAVDHILVSAFPGEDVLSKFNSFLLYFFGLDLVLRFLLQKLPILPIQHYLHLPIPRSDLVHYAIVKSTLSFFNLIPVFLFYPHAFKQISPELSPLSAVLWLAALTGLALANGFLASYLKRQLSATPASVTIAAAALVVVGLLDYYEVIGLSGLSTSLFSRFFHSPILLAVPLGLLVLSYRANYALLLRHTYVDQVTAASRVPAATRADALAARFGTVGALLTLELRLLWRNKRPKSVAFMSLFFLPYGLMTYGGDGGPFGDSMGFLVGVGIFMTGAFMFNYGQFLISWESAYFDRIICANISFRDYILAKYALLAGGCAACFLITTPYVYFGVHILLINAAALLYNVGVNSFLLLYLATFSRRRIDISKSSMFNWEGVGPAQFLLLLPTILIPILIYLPFSFAQPAWGIGALALFGAAGLLSSRVWIGLLTERLRQQKYTMAAAFRIG